MRQDDCESIQGYPNTLLHSPCLVLPQRECIAGIKVRGKPEFKLVGIQKYILIFVDIILHKRL